jgi:3-hydroxyisobutyrate dehydrogenase
VLSTIKAGATLIDLSTIDPETWREVAAAAKAKGADCIDAPVSGGPLEAGNGKLVFLLGGDAAVLERVRPVLTTLGTELHHIGPLGSGLVVKIVNNMMSIANVAVAAEAMVLGVKAGVEPKRLFEILSTSGGRSHHFLKRFPNVLAGDFTPNFGIGLSRKDIALALAMAGKLEMPVPLASAVRQVYEAAAGWYMRLLRSLVRSSTQNPTQSTSDARKSSNWRTAMSNSWLTGTPGFMAAMAARSPARIAA